MILQYVKLAVDFYLPETYFDSRQVNFYMMFIVVYMYKVIWKLSAFDLIENKNGAALA